MKRVVTDSLCVVVYAAALILCIAAWVLSALLVQAFLR